MVNGSARVVGWFSAIIRGVQTGYLNHYAFAMIGGLILRQAVLVCGALPTLNIAGFEFRRVARPKDPKAGIGLLPPVVLVPFAGALVDRTAFQNFILGVILFNAVILGLETSKIAMDMAGPLIVTLDTILRRYGKTAKLRDEGNPPPPPVRFGHGRSQRADLLLRARHSRRILPLVDFRRTCRVAVGAGSVQKLIGKHL